MNDRFFLLLRINVLVNHHNKQKKRGERERTERDQVNRSNPMGHATTGALYPQDFKRFHIKFQISIQFKGNGRILREGIKG